MELLLLLLPIALLGVFALDGGDDDDTTEEPARGAVIIGRPEDDEVLDGTSGDDLILANSGPDRVGGLAGNDILLSEGGNDLVQGGPGDDILLGANDNDTLVGGPGRDLLMGGADRDLIYGGADDDILIGGSDVDTLYGGDGNDLISGVEIRPQDLDDPALGEVSGALNDLIAERFGADVAARFEARVERSVLSTNVEQPTPGFIPGVPRPDFLFGGAGNDTLLGDFGDFMTGGEGDDTFVSFLQPGGAPVIIFDFGPGDSIVIDADGEAGVLSVTADDGEGFVYLGDRLVAVVDGVRNVADLRAFVSVVNQG